MSWSRLIWVGVLGGLLAAPLSARAACTQPGTTAINADGSPSDWNTSTTGTAGICEWQTTDPSDLTLAAGQDILGFDYTHSNGPNYTEGWILFRLRGSPKAQTYTITHPGTATSGGASTTFTIVCTNKTNFTCSFTITGSSGNCGGGAINVGTTTAGVAASTNPNDGSWYIELAFPNFQAADYSCFDNTSYTLSSGTNGTGADSVTLSGTSPNNYLGATALTLKRFAAHPHPRGVELRWETGAERGTLGFLVHRDRADGPVVNANPVPGQIDSPVGERYALLDPQGTSATNYYLEEVATNGNNLYGPAQHASAPAAPLASKRHHGHRASPGQHGGRGSATELYARVDSEGIYALDPQDLAAQGWRGRRDPQLSLDGAIQPLLSSGGSLYFYAGVPSSTERDTDAYLVSETNRPVRAATAQVQAAQGGAVASFSSTVHLEEHHTLDSSVEAAYRFPWAMAVSGYPQSVSFDAPGYAGGAALLSVNVLGLSDFAQTPDHHVQLSLNGVALGDTTFGGLGLVSVSASVPAGVLLAQGNTLTVTAVADLGLPYDIVALSSIDATYSRLYQASGDALAFTGNPRETLDVGGFSAEPVLVETTDPSAPVLVRGATLRSAADGYHLRFRLPAGSGARRFYAAVPRSPALAASRAAEVPAGSADYVAIYGDGLGPSLAPLLALRQSQGLSTLAVDADALADKFNAGEHGPGAVRRYLAQLSPTPRYVVLVGSATIDPRDYLQTGMPDLVPTVVGLAPDNAIFAVSDALLAAGPDGRTPITAVGRLPVQSAAELDALVQKLVAAETRPGSPSGVAVFAADDHDPETGLPDPFFQNESDRLATLLAPLQAARVYLPNQGNAELMGALAAGPDLVTYHGHAGVSMWSGDLMGDLSQLPPTRPFFLVTVDCWDGLFAFPWGGPPLAQQLLEAPQGGALAAFAASTLVEESRDVSIDDAIFPTLLDPNVHTVGDVSLRAQVAMAGTSDLERVYNLIGDPASHLPLR